MTDIANIFNETYSYSLNNKLINISYSYAASHYNLFAILPGLETFL